ncbi:VOC family protein [Rhizobium sp. BK251]|uniref:VOC family protein n=1 Tax=Rhizobium sp. BK251 TaxID=2512125 RepID=UPI00104ED230|nr:VOC family protein [Rhizobium sp. BK251]TCL74744.1 PhnB protein [Rhizobium sp. BK251]
MQLTPYLIFDGDCRRAFEFYQKCLGGEIVAMIDHSIPEVADHVPADFRSKIMHARLVTKGAILMGSDNRPGETSSKGGFSVSVQIETPGEAERIFQALSEGGKVTMPMAETFWASRFGMLVDRHGVPWMVNCEKSAA